MTDRLGQFQFSSGDSTCEIFVSRNGFEPFRQVLGAHTGTWRVSLKLASVRDAINVTAGAEDNPLLRSSLTSLTLSDTDLRSVSNKTEDLIRYATLRAGASGPATVYVNGLPASVLPPAETIARLAVNADPFSTEFDDGGQTHIDITTKGAIRDFRISLGGASIGAGGRNALDPGLRSESFAAHLNISGGIPLLPLSFSARTNIGYNLEETPIRAVLPNKSDVPRSAAVTNHNASGSLNVDCACSETLETHFSVYDSRSTGSNAGSGGINLPESAFSSRLWTQDAQGTLSKVGRTVTFRGGISSSLMQSRLQANSEGLGVTVLGNFVSGGSPMQSNESRRNNWTWKGVLEPTSGKLAWKAGMTVFRSNDFSREEPNPAGSAEFKSLQAYTDALAGRGTGTFFRKQGDGTVRYTSQSVALFADRELIHSSHLLVKSGLRADYQSERGIRFSPRLSAAGEWRKFILRAGGGVYTHNLPSDVFVRALKGDQLHLQQWIATGVSLREMAVVHFDPDQTIHSMLAADLTRSRDLMVKASVERSFGNLTPGIEYTWTRGRHLLGERRLPDGGGWSDVVESSRSSESRRTHAQIHYKWRSQTLMANYDWVWSRDNSDGFFSFPEDQNNVRAEWARSAGVSPHNVTLMGILQLPAGITLNAIDTWRSSAPYNITTGMDRAGSGLYTDRGGRDRNSGNGPAFHALSIYGFRRIRIPSVLTRGGKGIYLNLGLNADNLLGRKNYMSLGSVAGSGTFGQPLSALPGRSVRFWANLD